jgi:tRNA-(ms[2]io[6]A)-hydroxylase
MSNINYDELMKPVMDFLGCETPKAWLAEALNNLDVLMQDHANCEKKAAGTAMNLMFRYSFLPIYKSSLHNWFVKKCCIMSKCLNL